ncbi:histidine phosphatase family protein [Pseudonocardia zijingensis]|uniref:Histidine phosphatase family protein n=1 Tax=Pseudonocardia zijingensis TaxID=153376 RepID=A0ABN1PEK0_9PSEU
MKRLVVLRHAKSAWPDGVPDAERPLNPRGRRDAPAAGRWIREHVGHLDAVICSPAARTRQTWRLVAAELDGPPDAVFDDRIYEAGVGSLRAVVGEFPDDVGTALLVGHNPGVAGLVGALTGEEPEMKTSAIAVVELDGPWSGAEPGRARLVEYATPRG